MPIPVRRRSMPASETIRSPYRAAPAALTEHAEATVKSARESIYDQPAAAVATLDALLAELDRSEEGTAKAFELVRARIHEALSIGHRLLGNYEAGLRASDEAQRRYAQLGDEAGMAKACILAGNLH